MVTSLRWYLPDWKKRCKMSFEFVATTYTCTPKQDNNSQSADRLENRVVDHRLIESAWRVCLIMRM